MIPQYITRTILQLAQSYKRTLALVFAAVVFVLSGCSHRSNSTLGLGGSGAGTEHYILGKEHLQSGQYPAAFQEFSLASKAEPNNWLFRYELGGILEQQGKPNEAVSEYRKVIQIDYKGLSNPADAARWHFRLAGALYKAGHSQQAKSEYMTAFNIASHDQKHDKNLAALASQSLNMAREQP